MAAKSSPASRPDLAAVDQAIADNAKDWADYVVYAVFFLTFIGFAIAVNKRQYPTKKRRLVRDSEDDW